MPDHSVSSSCTGHEIASPRMNARLPCDDRMMEACPGVCPGVAMTLTPGAITSPSSAISNRPDTAAIIFFQSKPGVAARGSGSCQNSSSPAVQR